MRCREEGVELLDPDNMCLKPFQTTYGDLLQWRVRCHVCDAERPASIGFLCTAAKRSEAGFSCRTERRPDRVR